MTERFRDPGTNAPLNGPDREGEEKLRELMGEQEHLEGGEPGGYIDESDVEDLGQLTSMDKYQGELEAGVHEDLPQDPERLELMTELELRAEETNDVMDAVEEGFVYVPPIDPPTVPSDDLQDADIASGFGASALDEPYDAAHHSSFLPEDDEVTARVYEALHADSATTSYADEIDIETRGSVVVLRGVVSDLIDSDNLVAVASRVQGVTEVIDLLKVRSLEEGA